MVPVDLPSDEGNDLKNQLPVKTIIEEIKLISQNSRKITGLAGDGLHHIGRM